MPKYSEYNTLLKTKYLLDKLFYLPYKLHLIIIGRLLDKSEELNINQTKKTYKPSNNTISILLKIKGIDIDFSELINSFELLSIQEKKYIHQFLLTNVAFEDELLSSEAIKKELQKLDEEPFMTAQEIWGMEDFSYLEAEKLIKRSESVIVGPNKAVFLLFKWVIESFIDFITNLLDKKS